MGNKMCNTFSTKNTKLDGIYLNSRAMFWYWNWNKTLSFFVEWRGIPLGENVQIMLVLTKSFTILWKGGLNYELLKILSSSFISPPSTYPLRGWDYWNLRFQFSGVITSVLRVSADGKWKDGIFPFLLIKPLPLDFKRLKMPFGQPFLTLEGRCQHQRQKL